MTKSLKIKKPRKGRSNQSINKFVFNLLNKPSEFKPGQIWRLKRDCNEYLPIEILLSDTEYSDSIGIVRGVALSRIKDGGDEQDVILNKKYYPETLPNGRVSLRFTDCALPKDKLEFFIDEVTTNDWARVKQSLLKKESSYSRTQLNLTASFIDRLALYRNEALDLYEKWIDQANESLNKIKVLIFINKISKNRKIHSCYRLAASNLEDTIALDKLWKLVDANSDKIVNLYEDRKLNLDFIVLEKLPYLIFYAGSKLKIDSIELIKGNKKAKAADREFVIGKDSKVITPIDPTRLVVGDWMLKFNFNGKAKSISVRIE